MTHDQLKGDAMTQPRWTPIDDDEASSVIGEGLHTGFRKGTDAPEAHDLWVAIKNSDRAWSEALDFLVRGLGEMNLALCRKAPIGKDDTP
jgi:hypothetical protein